MARVALGAARARVLGVECCSASYARAGYLMTADSSRGLRSGDGRGQPWLVAQGTHASPQAATARSVRWFPCRPDSAGTIGMWVLACD